MTSEIAEAEPSSTIEWLELFFDLVVIAAVAVLSHGLREEPTWFGLGLFLLLYVAIWMTWVNVVLYADVAGEQTRVRTVLSLMLLVALMAATAPLHHEDRANAFAIAFVAARLVVGRRSMSGGKVLSSWPLLQFGGYTLPWVVSLWVDVPWKYAVWAVAVVADLAMVVLRGDRAVEEQLDRYAKRNEQHQARIEERARRIEESARTPPGRGGRSRTEFPELTPVEVDAAHLDERLGLLVIIVLGEAVTQLVDGAAGRDWDRAFLVLALGAFATLVGMWLLTFSFGFSAAPGARLVSLSPRFGLPLHLLTTLGILLLATGIGELAADPGRPLRGLLLWLMCGGLALYFAVAGVSGALTGAPRTWLWCYAVPSVAYAALLPLAAPAVGNAALAWLLAVPVAWQYGYVRRHPSSPADA